MIFLFYPLPPEVEAIKRLCIACFKNATAPTNKDGTCSHADRCFAIHSRAYGFLYNNPNGEFSTERFRSFLKGLTTEEFNGEVQDSVMRKGLSALELEELDAAPLPPAFRDVLEQSMDSFLPPEGTPPCAVCAKEVWGYAVLCGSGEEAEAEGCPARGHVHCLGLGRFKNIDELKDFNGDYICPQHSTPELSEEVAKLTALMEVDGGASAAAIGCQMCSRVEGPRFVVCSADDCTARIHKACLRIVFNNAADELAFEKRGWTCKKHTVPRFFIEGELEPPSASPLAGAGAGAGAAPPPPPPKGPKAGSAAAAAAAARGPRGPRAGAAKGPKGAAAAQPDDTVLAPPVSSMRDRGTLVVSRNYNILRDPIPPLAANLANAVENVTVVAGEAAKLGMDFLYDPLLHVELEIMQLANTMHEKTLLPAIKLANDTATAWIIPFVQQPNDVLELPTNAETLQAAFTLITKLFNPAEFVFHDELTNTTILQSLPFLSAPPKQLDSAALLALLTATFAPPLNVADGSATVGSRTFAFRDFTSLGALYTHACEALHATPQTLATCVKKMVRIVTAQPQHLASVSGEQRLAELRAKMATVKAQVVMYEDAVRTAQQHGELAELCREMSRVVSDPLAHPPCFNPATFTPPPPAALEAARAAEVAKAAAKAAKAAGQGPPPAPPAAPLPAPAAAGEAYSA